jgi:hypothetical protein
MGANRGQPFIYTLIGYALILAFVLLIGAILVGVGSWVVTHNVSHDSYAKWVGFIFFTVGGFGVIIKASRQFWHHSTFWIVLGGLFLLHTVGFSIVLWHVESWGLASSLVIFLLEVPVLMQLLGWARRRFGKPHGSKHLPAHYGTTGTD